MTAATGIEDNKNRQSFANSPSSRQTGYVVGLVLAVSHLVTDHSHYIVNSLASFSLYLYSFDKICIDSRMKLNIKMVISGMKM